MRFDRHQAPRMQVAQRSVQRCVANKFIGFVNSPGAIHAVSPRMPSRWFRRYVDFVADPETPIFDVPQKTWLQRRSFRLLHREMNR